jgi:DNA adenine methylase
LIYLNKTGFNGLFRVNKKGELNVPPAGGNDKNFLDIENLRSVSKVLRNVKILQGDYTICEDLIENNTFVYFDPPYRPLKSTSFTTYSTHVFDDKEQERLANFAVNLGNKGAKVMLSNSDPKNVDPNDDFFDNLYSMENGFKIDRVQAIRAINSKGDGRGRISELLIMNY